MKDRIIKTKGGKKMKFSKEEREYINKKLEEAEALQLKNGNKTYSLKEAWDLINKKVREMQYL